MTKHTWEFINTFSGWLSAIGTLIAVATAIYLSRRDKMIRLTVRASKGIVVHNRISSDVVWIAVANIGLRATKISNVYWKIGVWKPRVFIQTPSSEPTSDQMGTRLADGDTASYLFQIDTFTRTNAEIFQRELGRRWSKWWTLRTMKIGVTTSTGTSLESRIDRTLRDHFAELLSGGKAAEP
jgi:hypothetical protein